MLQVVLRSCIKASLKHSLQTDRKTYESVDGTLPKAIVLLNLDADQHSHRLREHRKSLLCCQLSAFVKSSLKYWLQAARDRLSVLSMCKLKPCSTVIDLEKEDSLKILSQQPRQKSSFLAKLQKSKIIRNTTVSLKTEPMDLEDTALRGRMQGILKRKRPDRPQRGPRGPYKKHKATT